MRRKATLVVAVFAVAGIAAWAAASVVGAADPRQQGEVVKVETFANGGKAIYREQDDGLVIVEHQESGGDSWFESNEVLGRDGEPIVCPDGETLKADLAAPIEEPTDEEFTEAERGLPDDKTLAFNEYTGEFEVVDSVRTERGGISMPSDPLVYECGPGNEPKVVHLSEVDPEAAAEVRREVLRQIDDVRRHGLLKGMNGDPNKDFAVPGGS